MRIGIQTWGSEGDVRPFLALAAGLVRAGHEVSVVVTEVGPRDYSKDARRGGFKLIPVASPVFPDKETARRIGDEILSAGSPLRQAKLIVERGFDPAVEPMFEAARTLCADSDLAVGHYLHHPFRTAADRAGVPYVSVQLADAFLPTALRKPFGFPELGAWSYRPAWFLARWTANRLLMAKVNALRDRVGLRRHSDVMTQSLASDRLNLVAVSPSLCPRPSDWEERHVVTGYLSESGNANAPAPELDAFLNRGEPPVYFGFGSMMPEDDVSVRLTVGLWMKAARRAGVRGIFQAPAGVEVKAGRDGIVVSRCPHAAVFSRCACVVHHGGAGTTHSVARAGVPSVVVAHIADQPYWAAVLRRAGVAGKCLQRNALKPEALGKAIREVVKDPVMRKRAADLGSAIRNENGVARAVECIETHAVSMAPAFPSR